MVEGVGIFNRVKGALFDSLSFSATLIGSMNGRSRRPGAFCTRVRFFGDFALRLDRDSAPHAFGSRAQAFVVFQAALDRGALVRRHVPC